jgi:hypothetical protein
VEPKVGDIVRNHGTKFWEVLTVDKGSWNLSVMGRLVMTEDGDIPTKRKVHRIYGRFEVVTKDWVDFKQEESNAFWEKVRGIAQ